MLNINRTLVASRIDVAKASFSNLPAVNLLLVSWTANIVARRASFNIPTVFHLSAP